MAGYRLPDFPKRSRARRGSPLAAERTPAFVRWWRSRTPRGITCPWGIRPLRQGAWLPVLSSGFGVLSTFLSFPNCNFYSARCSEKKGLFHRPRNRAQGSSRECQGDAPRTGRVNLVQRLLTSLFVARLGGQFYFLIVVTSPCRWMSSF